MKPLSLPLFAGCARRMLRRGVLLAAAGLVLAPAGAFPPAPHHLLSGMVRDEYGTPLNTSGAVVILESATGVQLSAPVIPDLESGKNYRLEVPMDSGLTTKAYMPTALRPAMAFRLKVQVGNTTYLPIELKGNFSQLGRPGQRTVMDLTLGEDANGDGLPDAWQRLVDSDISKVPPGGDYDGDGLTNLEEYLAGTYAFDPTDGFKLDIVSQDSSLSVLEFLAVTGRTYTLEGSADLATWKPLSFRLSATDPATVLRDHYLAADVRRVQLGVPAEANPLGYAYFRLLVH
jgi:hypothetical protein